MKFLVIGGYSAGNPGDEAILKSTVYDLDQLMPGSTFAIWTSSRTFEPKFDRAIARNITPSCEIAGRRIKVSRRRMKKFVRHVQDHFDA